MFSYNVCMMKKETTKKIRITDEERELLETGNTGINWTELIKALLK